VVCRWIKTLRRNPYKLSFAALAQECRALRFLQSQPGGAPCMAALRDGFGLVGHHCLVLERLRPSLLGLIAESAELGRRDALRQLRAVAFQLLVSGSHRTLSCSIHVKGQRGRLSFAFLTASHRCCQPRPVRPHHVASACLLR